MILCCPICLTKVASSADHAVALLGVPDFALCGDVFLCTLTRTNQLNRTVVSQAGVAVAVLFLALPKPMECQVKMDILFKSVTF